MYSFDVYALDPGKKAHYFHGFPAIKRIFIHLSRYKSFFVWKRCSSTHCYLLYYVCLLCLEAVWRFSAELIILLA